MTASLRSVSVRTLVLVFTPLGVVLARLCVRSGRDDVLPIHVLSHSEGGGKGEEEREHGDYSCCCDATVAVIYFFNT